MKANNDINKEMSRENRRLRMELARMKGSIFYMKYAKIVILAMMEIIAEMFNNYNKKGDK